MYNTSDALHVLECNNCKWFFIENVSVEIGYHLVFWSLHSLGVIKFSFLNYCFVFLKGKIPVSICQATLSKYPTRLPFSWGFVLCCEFREWKIEAAKGHQNLFSHLSLENIKHCKKQTSWKVKDNVI